MVSEKIFPTSYEELEVELGGEIDPFNQLFADAIRYFDSLLGQDARSSPGLEKSFIDRFVQLLEGKSYLLPRNTREILIKLSYGYFMKHQASSEDV